MIGGAVGAVHHQLKPLKGQGGGHRTLAELNVAPGGVLDAPGLAQGGGVHRHQGLIQGLLDGQFNLIRQLVAPRGEELDAVIIVGVMRGTDDDARGGAQGAGQIGDGRSRHGAEEPDIDARRRQPRLQGGLEHITRDASIFTNQYLTAKTRAQDPASRPA